MITSSTFPTLTCSAWCSYIHFDHRGLCLWSLLAILKSVLCGKETHFHWADTALSRVWKVLHPYLRTNILGPSCREQRLCLLRCFPEEREKPSSRCQSVLRCVGSLAWQSIDCALFQTSLAFKILRGDVTDWRILRSKASEEESKERK